MGGWFSRSRRKYSTDSRKFFDVTPRSDDVLTIYDDILDHVILKIDDDDIRDVTNDATLRPGHFRYPPFGREANRRDVNAPERRIKVAPGSATSLGEIPIKPGQTSAKLI